MTRIGACEHLWDAARLTGNLSLHFLVAFEGSPLLAVAKFGVLAGSVGAVVAGLLLGRMMLRLAAD